VPHAKQDLPHATTIAKQGDDLGGPPTAMPVGDSRKADDMLRFGPANEAETTRYYRAGPPVRAPV